MKLSSNGQIMHKTVYGNDKKPIQATSYYPDGTKSELNYIFDENGQQSCYTKSSYNADGILTNLETSNKDGKVLTETQYAPDGKTIEAKTENHYDEKGNVSIGHIAKGKNGFISGVSWYLTTHYHGIQGYNVDIIANSEEQATTSFNDIYENTYLARYGSKFTVADWLKRPALLESVIKKVI